VHRLGHRYKADPDYGSRGADGLSINLGAIIGKVA